jgi:4-carboxymuconolactone decarboxylase
VLPLTPDKEPAMEDLFEKGLKLRREVLGDAHVDRSLARSDAFNREMQQLTTEFGWGNIWSRPGLSKRDRSLLNLGMLTALNRQHELRVHALGALRNGLSPTEIKEALIQTACYCGFPAALDAFRTVSEVIAAHEAASKTE